MKRLLFLLALVVQLAAAQKQITVDDFTLRNTFAQKSVSGINWMNNGMFYTAQEGNKIIKYNVTTGEAVETLLDGASLNPPLNFQDFELSTDEKKVVLLTDREGIYRRSFKATYYVCDLATKSVKKLSEGGKQSYATLSPDGTRAAFVRDNNLFYVNLAEGTEVRVTDDGQVNQIINGSTDWVYEEELSFAKAFFWSPDGKRLAYYRFDESRVKEYNLQKWNKGALYPSDYRYKYPKAGEDNSLVEIWVYDLVTQKKVKANIGSETDIYIPRVTWTNNPEVLSIRRMNRLQNTLEILHTQAGTGESTVVLTEKSNTYVDIDYTDELIYLKDGKHFIMTSERTGYKHVYLYTLSGTLVKPITSGNWEVVQITAYHEPTKTLFYISTEGNHLNRSFYSLSLDGKRKSKLSNGEGWHTINLSPDTQYYLDYFSNAAQPTEVRLYKTKGNTLLKVLESNEAYKKTIAEYGFVRKEFFTYLSADGTTALDGYILKPNNFDPSKKYPVMVHQYSGPRSPRVMNNFGTSPWHQMLVQKGVLVAVLDTRGTGYRGEAFTKQTYKQLGKMETEDLVAGGKHLGSLPYVDKDRLGIWGWSFGGYTTSLVMTKGAGTYALGIAGAPVTTWRYYDNIYTERFLQRPQDNPSGYDDNSPVKYADKLEGKFLLIHGTGDDNVHFQNAVALEEALINAGKQFRSHFYPDQAHGFRGGKVNHHLYTLMTSFVLENL